MTLSPKKVLEAARELISEHKPRRRHSEVRLRKSSDFALPHRANNDRIVPDVPYNELHRIVSDKSDMPPVFSNIENIIPHASDHQHKQSDNVYDGSTYQTRIGFDTFDNKNASDFSFAISSKHKDYNYTRRSRTFLCGNDENDYSEFALEWLFEELVEDGDEIVCLRVLSPDSKINSDASIQKGRYRDEGHKLLDHLQAKNDDGKAINLILELAVGKVEETIQRMIETYAPACLIVGTRGRSLGGVQALRSGSVSKYCLQNSPVPVVVVRPGEKRKKKKNKRLADSRRQGYSSILKQSNAGAGGSGTLESQPAAGETSETEATAVAKAIGLNKGAFGDWKGFDKKDEGGDGGEDIGIPLRRASVSGPLREDAAYLTDSPSPEGPLLAMDDDDDTEDGLELKLGSPLRKFSQGNEAPEDA